MGPTEVFLSNSLQKNRLSTYFCEVCFSSSLLVTYLKPRLRCHAHVQLVELCLTLHVSDDVQEHFLLILVLVALFWLRSTLSSRPSMWASFVLPFEARAPPLPPSLWFWYMRWLVTDLISLFVIRGITDLSSVLPPFGSPMASSLRQTRSTLRPRTRRWRSSRPGLA